MTATNASTLVEYFREQRERNIKRYKSVALWVDRKAAREWSLHYGRLIRKIAA